MISEDTSLVHTRNTTPRVRKTRVAIVVSHPIQHFVHFYRGLAREEGIELRVIYASSIGARQYFDKDMGVAIQWQTDLLSGYNHVFLPEADTIKRTTFWKVNNPSVTAALEDFAPDVVKIHGYAQITLIRTLLWCRQHGVPVMIWSDSELLHTRSPLKRLMKQLVLRMLYRNIDACLTVGDNNAEYFRHYGVPEVRLFRVPFTIDEMAFANADANREQVRREWRNKLGISADAFAILNVGKLIDRKRPGDLVKAVKVLRSRLGTRLPLAIMFAGDGPLRAELEKEAADVKEQCFFLGFVNVDKLPEVYVAADALAHVSDMDPHPLTTSEASIVGLPLIISDRIGAIGPTDTARPGVNTLVYPCCDIEKLADAIQSLMADEHLRSRMSTASRLISRELNLDSSIRGFRKALDSITGENPCGKTTRREGVSHANNPRVAYFLTHPIQYQSPMIRRIVEAGVNMHVYYGTDLTSRPYYDPGFGCEVAWDVPLLEGYSYTVLEPSVWSIRMMKIQHYKQAIRRALQEQPADIIWLHGWNDAFVVAAWYVAAELKLPIMLRGETSRGSIRGGRIMRFLHRLFYSRKFGDIKAFLALGSLNRQLYINYGVDERRIFSVPHAVDNDFFRSRSQEAHTRRGSLRDKLGVPPENIIVLYSGRLAKEKGVDTLIKAVGRLNASGAPRCSLMISGDGPMHGTLEKLANAHAPGSVHFLGFQNQTMLPAIYDLCDLFVIPSRFEPWGLVVNEVMNAGKPVIVSNAVGAAPDLVIPGQNGEVFEAGNVDNLCEKLKPWLVDAALRERGGLESLRIIKRWSYAEDVSGVIKAVNFLRRECL